MKVLIVGGQGQGKAEYASANYGKPDIEGLHLEVHRLLKEQKDAGEFLLKQIESMESWIITCNEIGCGVVPMDAVERHWREEVGRLCCRAAEQADIVERIHCGIPHRIKG